MTLRNAGLALGAGLAIFIVVGVIVTELASTWIEFSLFIGLPAGLIGGVAVAAFVYYRLGSPDPTRRRPATALTGFGAAFLVVLFGGVTFGLRNSVALPIATVAGGIAAVALYLRFGERSRP